MKHKGSEYVRTLYSLTIQVLPLQSTCYGVHILVARGMIIKVHLDSMKTPHSRSLILRLQKVQNKAARLILGISKREHISPRLASLDWLPIDYRIKYKLACICYNCMSTNSPPTSLTFLPLLVSFAQVLTTLSTVVHLSVRYPMVKERSFAYSAPSAWNSLPQQVRSSDNVSTFRSRIKTHIFTKGGSREPCEPPWLQACTCLF